MKKRSKLAFVIIAAIIILSITVTACSAPGQPAHSRDGKEINGAVKIGERDNAPDENNGEGQRKRIDYQVVKPNEVGKIMILMYHVIGDSEGEWSRKWDNFKKDLEVLYERGYRLISLRDYISNDIDVEAGYTPVIITFDDGTQGQFNIIQKNDKDIVDPKCAVGILEDFYERKPDFGLKATFFVYYPIPFRQRDLMEYKFKYLTDRGMDIGNHTYGHANLSQLDAGGIQKQLGKMVLETKGYLPDYNVNALALPYGVNAKEQYREYVYSGEYEGVKYQNDIILLVGSNPAPSPVDKKLDLRRVPRVRATDDPTISTSMYYWMDYFDKNPRERYISDGNPDTVAVPRGMENRVDENRLGDKELIIYDLE